MGSAPLGASPLGAALHGETAFRLALGDGVRRHPKGFLALQVPIPPQHHLRAACQHRRAACHRRRAGCHFLCKTVHFPACSVSAAPCRLRPPPCSVRPAKTTRVTPAVQGAQPGVQRVIYRSNPCQTLCAACQKPCAACHHPRKQSHTLLLPETEVPPFQPPPPPPLSPRCQEAQIHEPSPSASHASSKVHLRSAVRRPEPGYHRRQCPARRSTPIQRSHSAEPEQSEG